METYIERKELVENPHYATQRRECLGSLDDAMIDAPIIAHIHRLNGLPCCFTLQSCYGHFVYNGQKDPQNLDPLPIADTIARVEYRIAYLGFCIENSAAGRGLVEGLAALTTIDPQNVQFGCAEWFWDRQVNSYVLQVEPDRFKCQDTADLGYQEARHIEGVRNAFYARLAGFLREWRTT